MLDAAAGAVAARGVLFANIHQASPSTPTQAGVLRPLNPCLGASFTHLHRLMTTPSLLLLRHQHGLMTYSSMCVSSSLPSAGTAAVLPHARTGAVRGTPRIRSEQGLFVVAAGARLLPRPGHWVRTAGAITPHVLRRRFPYAATSSATLADAMKCMCQYDTCSKASSNGHSLRRRVTADAVSAEVLPAARQISAAAPGAAVEAYLPLRWARFFSGQVIQQQQQQRGAGFAMVPEEQVSQQAGDDEAEEDIEPW